MKNEYRVKAVCVVCGKDFLARYNVGRRAKTCTPKSHGCRRVEKDGKVLSVCFEKCCRSQYRAGAAAAAMDNAIDPRKVLEPEEFSKVIKGTYRTPKGSPSGS